MPRSGFLFTEFTSAVLTYTPPSVGITAFLTSLPSIIAVFLYAFRKTCKRQPSDYRFCVCRTGTTLASAEFAMLALLAPVGLSIFMTRLAVAVGFSAALDGTIKKLDAQSRRQLATAFSVLQLRTLAERRFYMRMGAHINMELSIEKIRYYAVPYLAAFRGTRWFFHLLYPNTYDLSFAIAEDYVGRPWYIVPHATRYGIFAFEVDFDGEYFIVTVCPQLVAEPLLKGIMPESVIFVLKTRPAVVIEVHKEGVEFFCGWLSTVKKNPRPFFEAAEQFYQCNHLVPL